MLSKTSQRHEAGRSGGGHGRTFIGFGLIVGSAVWGVGKLGWSINAVDWSILIWPIIVAIAGVLVLLRGGRKSRDIAGARS